jgi:hypothetical protein
MLDAHLDAAVASGGWAMREVHGVADQSWEPVPLDVYLAHLDHVAALVRTRRVWMAPPSDVIRYRFARELSGAPAIGSVGLEFPEARAEAARYESSLSVIVRASNACSKLVASQQGALVPTVSLGAGRHLVDVAPRKGPAKLECR